MDLIIVVTVLALSEELPGTEIGDTIRSVSGNSYGTYNYGGARWKQT
jgi:hypothetical protein